MVANVPLAELIMLQFEITKFEFMPRFYPSLEVRFVRTAESRGPEWYMFTFYCLPSQNVPTISLTSCVN